MSDPESQGNVPANNRFAVDVLPRDVLPDGTVIVYGAASLPLKPDLATLDRVLGVVRERRLAARLALATEIAPESSAVVERLPTGSTMSQSPTNEAGFTVVSGPSWPVSADAIRATIARQNSLGEE